ncbi:MAG: POTRA domain-containing protein [Pyrinomonadaceae bacterium]
MAFITGKNGQDTAATSAPLTFVVLLKRYLCVVFLISLCSFSALSQNKYDNLPVSKIDVVFTGTGKNDALAEQYRLMIRLAIGGTYSAPRIREAVAALYETNKVDTVVVTAANNAAGDVELRFDVKRKTQAERVSVVVGASDGDKITEQDLLFKLNLLTPGTAITEQTLQNNANEILDYLRERGYYRSAAVYERRPLQNENEVGVTFKVTPNEQARVEDFQIKVQGYEKPITEKSLRLKKGGLYSRERLLADVAKIRDTLRNDNFLAPDLDEPRVTYDGDTNKITISIVGKVGPKVDVTVETEKGKLSKRVQTRLLPIKREGTLDYSAIVEGERRLANYYQEEGYFFAKATAYCSATPPITDDENNLLPNDTIFLCGSLASQDLMGREVTVKYRVNLDRRLRLTQIRVRGTNKLTYEDIQTVLSSQEANLLGIVPVLGYGRGYTSEAILADDQSTIKSLMYELGYQNAEVRVNQGVSLDGENLIITFEVEEGIPTVVTETSIIGNKTIPTGELQAQLPPMLGINYSRARTRNAVRKIAEYYSNLGYYDARVNFKVIDPENVADAKTNEVKVEIRVDMEGKQVEIKRVLINGNEDTKTTAVVKALAFTPGDLLKATDIYSSEQNLYGSDAFSRVEIKPQPAGDKDSDRRLTDVIVNLDEQPSRLMSYGGGYSTDLGLSGFFDIRHVNLFGNLWQGGARVKVSQKQQLVQLDFINPRFLRDGEKRFAPLTLSAQYQRDTTVTRFFRSTFDKGTFGIVQRIDANGNPIDEFGANVGSPTINRLSLSAETNRTISRRSRSILFLRYKFEDVRLFNTESLLVKDLLRPDAKTRISGFGATFVRDTRRNCSAKYSLLDLIAKGDQSERCRYNASDPTHGGYLTADYNVSVPALGASIGFQKFQASYNFYYTFPKLKNTTLAARAILGVGSVFSDDNRFTSAQFPSLNGLLPISERFFAGGSNNLRGFDFEEAGPRVVIVPQGIFRNSRGEIVTLDPFTIPFGGNALAVANLEARIPFSKSIRMVPFYDGGNVFRKVGEIFKAPTVAAGDIAGQNQRAVWTHSVGLGLRIKTPVGGEFGVDYGHLLSPPRFLIPQPVGPPAEYRLRQGHLHFRFSQAF